MHAELLTIGSELTSGATVNTNAAFLARRLTEAGLSCARQTSVSDTRDAVLDALREALGRSDVIITTGGLGPTFDDLTMALIAEATARPLTHRRDVARQIKRFYTRHHRKLQQAALRQALLPEGGLALPNPIGTAPGLWLDLDCQVVIALPGVPSEMRAIMDHAVLPRLKRLEGLRYTESLTVRTSGIVELQIEQALQRTRVPEWIQIGLYPNLRTVDVRLTAVGATAQTARPALVKLARYLEKSFGQAVYGTGERSMEEAIGELLAKQGLTLAVAESCTGGLVSDRITDVSGSSRYLRGSVVAYHNDLKTGCLGVSPDTIARHGAVSAPTACEMAAGVRRMAKTDLGLSVTGIAGPTGGTSKKPVGLIVFGLADRSGVRSHQSQFFGDRASVKAQAAQTALDLLRRHLLAR